MYPGPAPGQMETVPATPSLIPSPACQLPAGVLRGVGSGELPVPSSVNKWPGLHHPQLLTWNKGCQTLHQSPEH